MWEPQIAWLFVKLSKKEGTSFEEAQINTNTPKLYLPTTICHEIAHQIGYSAEDEANFIGIMAAISSQNKFISYSGNIQALRYLLNEIYVIDKLKFKLT